MASDKLLDALNTKSRDETGEKQFKKGPEISSTFQENEDDDEETKLDDNEAEEEKLELESFKRFLDKSKDIQS